MPKFTITGKEIGSSECGAIVLGKTAWLTRQQVLDNTKKARNNSVDISEKNFESSAARRGNRLEPFVGQMASEDLGVDITYPDHAHRNEQLRIGASIDAIITNDTNLTIANPLDGKLITFPASDGIMEIKTDTDHRGVPKPEWVIQVHHQMLCSGIEWAVIAVFTQKMEIKIYPIVKNEETITQIKTAIKEFWHLVDNDMDYAEVVEKETQGVVDLSFYADKINAKFSSLCEDYIRSNNEAKHWSKIASEIKDTIIVHMESINVEEGFYGPPGDRYLIKVKSTEYLKGKKVLLKDTPENYGIRTTFAVKHTTEEQYND